MTSPGELVAKREAAGTVTLRREAGEVQILLVSSLDYADPTLPKGGLQPGESAAACAVRETREETGYEVSLEGDPAVVTARLDRFPPVVEQVTSFFPARPRGTPPVAPTDPVISRVQWLSLRDARAAMRRPEELRALELCEARVPLEACLLVDADACPRACLDIARTLARSHGWPVVTVSSFHHDLSRADGVQHVAVSDEPEATDLALANRVRPGDIVVTQDYGLAALVLGKRAAALSPGGRVYAAETIDFLLAERYLKAKYRRGGGRTRGPAARTSSDDARFEGALRRLLEAGTPGA